MLELAVWPAEILKNKASPVDMTNSDVRDEVAFLAQEMFKTMRHHKGIGLAAPQVNLDKRMLVMDCGNNPLVLINPKVEVWTTLKVKYPEGCLSFPGFLVDVERPEMVRVSYYDLDGKEQDEWFYDLEARCVQHEIDHLDGITFLRYTSRFHRAMIRRKLEG
jgi:peptide deformylase